MGNKNELVNFLFYVDPQTELVDAVYAFSPFGMSVRKNSDWVGVNRPQSGIDDRVGHRFYTMDWDKVPRIESAVEEFDPEAVKLFDQGGMTEEVLKEYATLAYDGTKVEED